MKKSLLLFLFGFVFTMQSFAQLQSPEQFLGYKIGTQYTRHNKIVDYIQHVTKEVPQMVRLQQYGKTNEDRPLYLLFVSSANHISNLENIRLNNLRLAKQSGDNVSGNTSTPSIVWLSYNVHGNETSSTEAAMLTLYSLVDSANSRTKQWLQNTVIIIDPCLNPDGRERYVNWYTSVLGKHYTPRPDAREHREPWPGGRSNHYYFDLNRDWAWQTQLESQQRVKQYNQWLPQVHVDFHEQGYNEPYYFAPAAEPYHEVITPFQRSFQKTIGRNHARYFDENGWLYFTNERFDLLYPSYGDTYPIYNGSIGMTYEQGGIGAGLGVQTLDGDTLTLVDRALHHFTTSLSTIETASKNSDELISEFKKYFDADHSGQYKSYIIKNKPEDQERINALLRFFEKNHIEYGHSSGSGSGYDYQSGKNASYTINTEDIVLSGTQPKSALVRVLFDPNPKLSDSITYDITTWALPYAYGVTAYASKQNINVNHKSFPIQPIKNNVTAAYGYVIKWLGVPSAAAVGQLLQKGIRIRQAETAFTIGQQTFPAGSSIILKNGNGSFGNSLENEIAKIADENGIAVTTIGTGMVDKGFDMGSSRVRMAKAPNVVLLSGRGTSSLCVGDVWHFMDEELKYPVTLIDVDNINGLDWNRTDVLILPDGFYSFFNDTFNEKLTAWIRNGGKLIALEGAVAQLSKQKWSTVKMKEDKKDSAEQKDPYAAVKIYEDRERQYVQQFTPGSVLKVDVDNTHPLMFGYPKHYFTLKTDTNLYEFIKDGGWNAGVIKKDSRLSGYVGSKLSPKLKDGLVFGVQDLGQGSIIYFTDNVLFRNFWQNGKLMFANALFMAGN